MVFFNTGGVGFRILTGMELVAEIYIITNGTI